MIHQKLYIDRYGWTVYVFYAVRCYHADEIVGRMEEIGCSEEDAGRAYQNMACGILDNGITFSNTDARKTVFVVGLTSSAKEFANSFVHEIRHLVNHICEAVGIPLDSEDSSYLAGYVAGEMFERCHSLLCDGCRDLSTNKYNNYEFKSRD